MSTQIAPPARAETPDAPQRVALVIANQDYPGVDRLQTPVSDARLIGAELATMGYSVDLETNRTRAQMADDLARFSRMAAGARVAVLYYAGHGFEVGGENYLIPVDVASVRNLDQDEARARGIPLRYALLRAGEGNPQTLVALLDACRTPPARGAGPARGFAAERAATGRFVAFSSSSGGEALDSMRALGQPIDHSPFAWYLAQHITDPRVSIVDVMQQVQVDVADATDGVQRPWFTSGLAGWLSLAAVPQKYDASARPHWTGLVRGTAADAGAVASPSARPVALAGFGTRLPAIGTNTPKRWLDEEVLVDHAALTLDAASAAVLRLWSQSGDTRATTALALAYERGAPGAAMTRDAAQAATLYAQAAQAGDALAALWLGQMLARGDGVPQNADRAKDLLREAADADVIGAAAALDLLEHQGTLAPRYTDSARDANLGIAAELRPDQLGD
ncbi:caspase family protein [Paraburkholderia sp. J12]|uniref:caspase family protein n=1 Tax=Paraburkholderia sp. J12 TaxID=2805432 RepID=UPI002ABE922D|nr:caspase family protein [Paraburkholderia sp. J12]